MDDKALRAALEQMLERRDLSEVQAAQKEVLVTARRLSESGQIALGGAGGEAMI